ncbi:gas vesicle protein GvpL [Natronorarus salvus]|uniref:gas vesicle protein GvpL n=1 Tax=Natronorarus salvus TaxID=3117733 RepID=UPI002F2636E0
MTDDEPGEEATDGSEPPSFEEGRYLFCAVSVEGSEEEFTADGIEGGPVSIVERDGIGAVVQQVGSLFDSGEMEVVKRWLLDHQRVVDEAGEAFGTPIPFRFDTIVTGEDEAVRGWLAENDTDLRAALDSLSGRWEYRIDLQWDESIVRSEAEEDEELRSLADRIDAANEGTAHLLGKQYERQVSSRVGERRSALADRLVDRLAEHAHEIEVLERRPAVVDAASGVGKERGDSVVRVSLLADEASEGAIGDVLEEFAAEAHLSVSYTGPWPPYSHAPAIGGAE